VILAAAIELAPNDTRSSGDYEAFSLTAWQYFIAGALGAGIPFFPMRPRAFTDISSLDISDVPWLVELTHACQPLVPASADRHVVAVFSSRL